MARSLHQTLIRISQAGLFSSKSPPTPLRFSSRNPPGPIEPVGGLPTPRFQFRRLRRRTTARGPGGAEDRGRHSPHHRDAIGSRLAAVRPRILLLGSPAEKVSPNRRIGRQIGQYAHPRGGYVARYLSRLAFFSFLHKRCISRVSRCGDNFQKHFTFRT